MLKRTTLVTMISLVLALALLMLVLPTPDAPAADGDALVIDNARYFDGMRMHEAAAITVREGRIVSIDAPGGGPESAQRIDASGKTLLPGLFDAHVHTFASAQTDAVRFGVTTLLDMFTSPTLLEGAREARDAWTATDRAALFSAGMLATVDGGHGTQYGIEVDTLAGPDDAPAWVAARVAEGSDYIKLVYMPYAPSIPSLDLATATAVIDAAHDAGLMAVAHVSSLAGASELLDAGIDGFVHVFADREADADFIGRAVERGVFVVPTLAVIAMVDGASTGPALIDDPDLGSRLSPAAATNLRQDFGNEHSEVFDLDTALTNVRLLHAAGVPILAGSDAPNPGTAHGATVHAELALLVRAGLSETDALAAATSVPAHHFGTTGRGVIAPGARADLVLVDGEPDADITATRRIDVVLRNGVAISDAAPATGETRLELSGMLGDFDEGLTAPEGMLWADTSDTMMGGSSTAAIARVARDGGGGALAIDATVNAGFAFPWAGAYLGATAEGIVGDLGDARAIAFDVRGTEATYRLMLFVSGGMGAPPTAEFRADADWRRVEIPLSAVTGFDPARFAGMAFVTPTRQGDYDFEIDNVALLR